MSRLLIVQAGPHRGIWVRTPEHRNRLWEAMSWWSEDAKTVASTMPVRIAPTPEGWAYLASLVAAEKKFESLLPALRKVTPAEGMEEVPYLYLHGDGPSAPCGIIRPFREEWSHHADGTGGVRYYAVDGQDAGGGGLLMTRLRTLATIAVMSLGAVTYLGFAGLWLAGIALLGACYVVLVASL